MAVVGPERSDFLPAIPALVPFSTATSVAHITVVFSMIIGGCRHHRRGTKPFILA